MGDSGAKARRKGATARRAIRYGGRQDKRRPGRRQAQPTEFVTGRAIACPVTNPEGLDGLVALPRSGARTKTTGRRRRCSRCSCRGRLASHRCSRHTAITAGNERVHVGGKMLWRKHHFKTQRLAGRQESGHARIGLTRFGTKICLAGNPGLTGDVLLLELARSTQRPQLPERFASASWHGCTVHVGLQSPVKKKCADVHSSIEHVKRSVRSVVEHFYRFLMMA